MTPADLKALKRLAAICRKAGISHFKNEQFEFTLTDEVPLVYAKNKQEKQPVAQQTSALSAPFQSDNLTDDELLYWSVGRTVDEIKEDAAE